MLSINQRLKRILPILIKQCINKEWAFFVKDLWIIKLRKKLLCYSLKYVLISFLGRLGRIINYYYYFRVQNKKELLCMVNLAYFLNPALRFCFSGFCHSFTWKTPLLVFYTLNYDYQAKKSCELAICKMVSYAKKVLWDKKNCSESISQC